MTKTPEHHLSVYKHLRAIGIECVSNKVFGQSGQTLSLTRHLPLA